jgi:hypothetical protein
MLPHRTVSTRTQVALAAVVLVALAGCSGLTGAGTGGGPTATDTPTPTGPPYQNLSAEEDVLATHQDALAEYGTVTVQYREVYNVENGSGFTRTFTATYNFTGDSVRAHVQRGGEGAGAPDQDAYTVDGITYVRDDTEGGATYRKREAGEQPRVPLTRGAFYFYQFSPATPIENSSRADYQYVVTQPESLTREGIIYYGEQKATVTDLNITANATRSGIITEYDQRVGLEIGSIVRHYEVVNVGSATVDKPAWVDDAKEATADETPAPAPESTPDSGDDGGAVAA